MQNAICLYRLYDIAEEVNLEQVEQILAQDKPTSRLRLSRIRPKSMQIKNPPVAFELAKTDFTLLDQLFEVAVSGKVYDFGAVTIILRILMPDPLDIQLLTRLSAYLDHADNLEPVFERYLHTVKRSIETAVIKEDTRLFSEDFTIFYFRQWDDSWDPVPVLLGETEPISDQTRADTLQHSFTYGPKDLTIITWDSAIVYDAGGSTDIPDLLEFATAQLMELRYYDSLLNQELENMYDAIEEAEKGGRFQRLSHYRLIMKQLMELVADVTEITGKIQNSLKVTEDIFYARIYSAALSIFRTKTWAEDIQHKINVVERSYSMLSDEIVTHRSLLLELAIVFLFILEIVLGFMPFFH